MILASVILATFAAGHAIGWRMGRLFEVYSRATKEETD